MGLPQIEIIFKQKAVSAVKRSALGIVGFILKETAKNWTRKEYKTIADIESTDYSDENFQMVKDCFMGTPNKVVVYNVGTGTLSDILKLIGQERINWVGIGYDGSEGDTQLLISWIKSQRKSGKTYKAVTYKGSNPNEKGVVNFVNEKVVFVDSRKEKQGFTYIASLLGIFAGLPITRSATTFLCSNLEDVSIIDDYDSTIDNGGLCLIKEAGDIRIARACTSLKDITQDETEDMKDIIIIESMDLMRDDIYNTFKGWIGKYKNKYDNQVLFFSAINAYFKQLEKEDILDKEYDNFADVDVDAQKLAWLSVGKTEVSEWDDEKIKKTAFKKWVFMQAQIKILNAVEDFKFVINMF